MKDAVRFFTTAFGILIGITLILYKYSDFLSSMLFGEVLIIGTYTFIFGVFVISSLQKKITSNHIKIRLKKLNWIPLIIWLILGSLTISQGFRYPELLGDELFGFIHEKTAIGIGFIILGLFQSVRAIVIDKKGIRINDWLNSKITYLELRTFNLQRDSIDFQTETKKFSYKIHKLTDSELQEINKRVDNLTKSTIAQQCV
jgi:hypothetical protein